MEAEIRDKDQEGRVKRKTLLEVLEQCQKVLESLNVMADDDNHFVWEIDGVRENCPGSSCPDSLVKKVNELSSGDKVGLIDEGRDAVVVLECDICEIKCSNLQELEQHKSGKRHRKKVLYLDKAIKAEKGSDDSFLLFRCEICKIECPKLQSLKRHLGGKHHNKKVAVT